MGAPILSEAAIQEAFRKYREGIMLKDLADHYGVNPKTLGSIFARKGLKRGAINNKKTESETPCAECPEDCKYMMQLAGKKGQKAKNDEKAIGHCGYILFPGNGMRGCDPGPGCIRYKPKKKKAPKPIQVKKPRPTWDKEKGRQMWLEGKSDREIADAVGVHPETIRKIRRRKWMIEEVGKNENG